MNPASIVREVRSLMCGSGSGPSNRNHRSSAVAQSLLQIGDQIGYLTGKDDVRRIHLGSSN